MNLFYPPVPELQKFIQKNHELYIPINGGSSLRCQKTGINNLVFDDIGDNISGHNHVLNEYTSIYYAWKHYDELVKSDYVGFCHYRRFFSKNDIDDAVNYDFTVSKPVFPVPLSIAAQYKIYHYIQDLQLCANVIKTLYPEYHADFVNFLNTEKTMIAPCNMFITTKKNFETWCEFIFPILFQLEREIDVSGRDNYQKRAVCFLSERIFSYWIYKQIKNGLNVKQVDIIEKLEFKNNTFNERGTF